MLTKFSNHGTSTVLESTEVVTVCGCMDLTACNYNELANNEDGSCEYAAQYYDCDDNCLNDSDSDGVCDELEIVGCQDDTACNYDGVPQMLVTAIMLTSTMIALATA